MDLGALIPLAIGSAVVPVQIVITVLLLRSPAGPGAATAWVAGMATVRLAQGLLLAFVLGTGGDVPDDGSGPGLLASVLLLVVAILLYAGALKAWLGAPDEDAPPPRWMTAFEGIAPGRAFLLGAGLVLASVKLWVFTLSAIAVIEAAAAGPAGTVAWYVAFTVAALSVSLVLLGIAWLRPAQAQAILGRVSDGMERHNRLIVMGLGVVFGSWFLIKALDGLGIL
jgi:hypothetical protein